MDFQHKILEQYLLEYTDVTTLLENKRTYEAMMKSTLMIADRVMPNFGRQKLQNDISKYIRILRRNDRIVWALRWLRMDALIEFRNVIDAASNKDYGVEELSIIEQLIGKYTNWSETSPFHNIQEMKVFTSRPFTVFLEHIMSFTDRTSDNYVLPIDEYTFNTQAPSILKNNLQAIEKTWADGKKAELENPRTMYNNARKVIDFGNGFAWWDLGEEYCDEEGRAMGHCGNHSGMSHSDDHVFSLRKEVKRAGVRKSIPFVTFIIRDGIIGEMKGRGNNKPEARYHKYIIPLIVSDEIKKIKGGGYLPGNNFSINDLTKEEQEYVFKKRPDLMTALALYQFEGATEKFKDTLMGEIYNRGLPEIYGFDGETVILSQFDNYRSLANNIYYDPTVEVIKFIDMVDEEDVDDKVVYDNTVITEEFALELFQLLPYEYLQLIADDLGIAGSVREFKTLRRMALYFNNSKYNDTIREIIADNATIDKSIIKSTNFINYAKVVLDSISFDFGEDIYDVYLDYSATDLFNTPIKLTTSISTTLELIEAASHSDDSVAWAVGRIINEGTYINSDNEGWWYDNLTEMVNEDDDLKRTYHIISEGKIDIEDMDIEDIADEVKKYFYFYESKADGFTDFIVEMRRRSGIKIGD